jgi:hypothetical protein
LVLFPLGREEEDENARKKDQEEKKESELEVEGRDRMETHRAAWLSAVHYGCCRPR